MLKSEDNREPPKALDAEVAQIQPHKRQASFIATMRAVFWSFLGIRKKSSYEQDAANLNPVHVIIAGIIAAILFVLTLIVIVKNVVAK